MEDIYKLTNDLRNHKENLEEKKHLELITPEGLNRDYIRKTFEYVMHGSEIKVNCTTPKGKIRGEINTQENKAKYKNEAIVVKAKGRTYAEMLISIKQTIDIKKTDIEIKNIRKIRGGDLLMTMQKGK